MGLEALSINTSAQGITSVTPDQTTSGSTQNGAPNNHEVNHVGMNSETMDGNESEDSAMLESPISDKDEDKPPFN